MKGGGDGGNGGDDGGGGGGDGGGGIDGGGGRLGVGVALARPSSCASACARGEDARMSRRSRTPWTHELVDGATGSYLRGSCHMRRQRARGPNERARNAGGVLGMCGATRRGRERGGEGAAGVKCGRRVGDACGVGLACGWGRCARARAGVGRDARTSASISTPLPRREITRRKKVVDPRVRGQSYSSDPADRRPKLGAGAAMASAPAPAPARARNGR